MKTLLIAILVILFSSMPVYAQRNLLQWNPQGGERHERSLGREREQRERIDQQQREIKELKQQQEERERNQ